MKTKEDMLKMADIAKRADEMGLMDFDRLSLLMDLGNVHEKVGLRLDDFLNSSDGDFAHDIVGIQNNMDRSLGILTNCFLPRFSKY